MKIAIIGAGLSGLTLANKLKNKHNVCLFEKSRGVSGRIATKTIANYTFDMGAPFIETTNTELLEEIEKSISHNSLAKWTMQHNHYKSANQLIRQTKKTVFIGIPKMTAWCRNMANFNQIALSTQITTLKRQENSWYLISAQGDSFGPFDWVISTTPAEQASQIMPNCNFSHFLESRKAQPAYMLLLAIEQSLPPEYDFATYDQGPIESICCNHNKPQRNHKKIQLVIKCNKEISHEHTLHLNDALTTQKILDQLTQLMSIELQNITIQNTHLWRYATYHSTKETHLIDDAMKLAACGDYCSSANIEGAYISACKLAKIINNE